MIFFVYFQLGAKISKSQKFCGKNVATLNASLILSLVKELIAMDMDGSNNADRDVVDPFVVAAPWKEG